MEDGAGLCRALLFGRIQDKFLALEEILASSVLSRNRERSCARRCFAATGLAFKSAFRYGSATAGLWVSPARAPVDTPSEAEEVGLAVGLRPEKHMPTRVALPWRPR